MKGVVIGVVLLLSFYFFLPVALAKDDNAIPKKRIVALVYDDSGSMYERVDQQDQKTFIDNWKYANYSLQSLVGLLDEQDLLFVIPMSKPGKVVDISLGEGNRQKEIDAIRSWNVKEVTPVQSIHTAMDQLVTASEKHPEAEVWLIVLTDGVFNELTSPDLSQSERDQYKSTLKESLQDLTTRFQDENKPFHSSLVTIESGMTESELELIEEFKTLWKDTTNGSFIKSRDADDIVSSIQKVAALITNRDPSSDDSFDLKEEVNGEIIKLSSPFPLERITIIEQSRHQEKSFSIKNVALEEKEEALRVSGPFRIKTPEDPNELSSMLTGTVTHLLNENSEEAIPAGNVTLTLDAPLSDMQQKEIRFIAEPALDFSIDVSRMESDGTLNNDPSSFYAGSQMELGVSILDSQTKKQFELIESEAEIFHVTAMIDGEDYLLRWNNELQTFQVPFELIEKDNIEVMVNVRINGFYQKQKTIILHGYPIRDLQLKVVNPDWKWKVNELDHASPIEVIPTYDGMELTQEELSELWETLKVELKQARLTYDLTQKENHILLTPQSNWPVIFTPVGKLNIHLSMDGKYPNEYAEVTLHPTIENIPWYRKYLPFIIGALFLLLFVFYLIGLIVKPRFRSDRISIHYHVFYITNGERFEGRRVTEDFKGSFMKRWLIPYFPEKKTIGDLTFRATRKSDKVELTKGSQTPDMIVADEKLGEQSGQRNIQIFNNDEIVVRHHAREEHYVFRAG